MCFRCFCPPIISRISFLLLNILLLGNKKCSCFAKSEYSDNFNKYVVDPFFNPLLREECRPKSAESSSDPFSLPTEFSRCVKEVNEAKNQKHPLIGKDTTEIIEYYGYPSETHEVTTQDKYIITLHRIPSDGTSVLLQHGLGGCSDNWMLGNRNQSLAFVLADLGYDVWLANSRGTSYSKKHKTYSSDDIQYWDFSWHESGMYDLPASVKHIMSKNGNKSIFYVGHSQGTTIFMVGASTMPASKIVNQNNILAAFLFTPAAFLGRTTTNARILGPPLMHPYVSNSAFYLLGGRIENGKQLDKALGGSLLATACSYPVILCGGCALANFVANGFNTETTDYPNLPHAVDKFPNTLPLKNVIHYGQSISYCSFRQFDYGLEENRKRYNGSKTPPNYELDKINIPTYMFGGKKDGTCVPEDVQRTADHFRKDILQELIWVDYNHVDFATAKNVKELVYDTIIEKMKKFEN